MQVSPPSSSGPSDSKIPFRVDSPTLAREIKIYMERHEQAVGELIALGDEKSGAEASLKWSRVFDGLLCSLFCAARTTVGDSKTWESLSLAAVGSYGRGNFSFRSDLDVRLLCSKPKKATEIAEALLYPLWDAGLQIGHQVVTISDTLALAKRDLPTATTLLDWRHLAGDKTQSHKLQSKAFSTLFSPANVSSFIEEMHGQAAGRTARFGDSVYLLEPDVKNGEGGQRDLDIVNWTAQARWRAHSLNDLVEIGVLAPAEYQQIAAASAFLARVRNILHYKSPRRTERLGFETQEIVALAMGYGIGGAGCEQLMSDYYRHARVVANARESMLLRAEPRSRVKQVEECLENGIVIYGDSVAVEHPDRIADKPVLALRAYWEAVHRSLGIDPSTRLAIARALSSEETCALLRKDAEAATLFRRLVRKSRRVKFKKDSTLSEFHDVGILLAMIPEFKPVVGRVHHDIYHVYTVDVHSIAAVDKLRKLCRGELSDQYPVATRLATDIARPQVLFMATLLHDIGKDTGGRAHSERGSQLCATILRRLGVQDHDVAEVQHLVLKHLRMYHVASRRDIDDPRTIESFRNEVHGPEGLKELYLLTVCDVATTSPTALTTWKARMMAELYVSTQRSFEGLPAHTEKRAENLRAATLEVAESDEQRAFLPQFLDSIHDRYMYANEPAQILIHAETARRSEGNKVWVEAFGRRPPYVELGFVVDDEPGVLALIAAALAANRIRVAGAQLYSWVDRNQRRRVLDIFWVRAGRDPELVERAMARVRDDLAQLLSGEVDADVLIAKRTGSRLSERPSPNVRTMINFDNRSASHHTVIEVIAEDRTGLLYRLAKALREEDIQVALAKINTEGNAVADIFYVTDRHGKKLTAAGPVERLSVKLRAAAQKSSFE